MGAPSKTRWLNSTVPGIGLASPCSDIGHEMATTSMPVLLASLGVSSAALGLIEGLADGLSSFAKLLSGVYSDRLHRRKPLAVAGYFVTASGMASFALATQWWHVLLGRGGVWLGRGARTPVRNVLLTEATTPETYGRAFGLERAMDSAAAIVGLLLALAITATLGMRWIFALTRIPGLAAALLIALLVREKPHPPHPHARLWSGVGALPHSFRKYLVGVGLAGLSDFSNTLLILWATQARTPRLGAATAASLAMAFYVGYNVIYTLSCYVSGGLADRFDRHKVLGFGYSIGVIPASALIWPGDPYVKFAVVFGFSGLYMGIWETLENATAATMLPAAVGGTGFGLVATVNTIGDLLSSVVVGFLWVIHPVWAMTFVTITCAGGAAVIVTTPAVFASSDAVRTSDEGADSQAAAASSRREE